MAEAKECLKPGSIDGFFSNEVLIKKSILKSIEHKKLTLRLFSTCAVGNGLKGQQLLALGNALGIDVFAIAL